jgi:hypothetical protein
MTDKTTNQTYERWAANPESAMLLARIGLDRTAETAALEAIERLLPELTVVAPAKTTQTYAPEVQQAVTELAVSRQQSELDNIRADVAAIHQGIDYGRAA